MKTKEGVSLDGLKPEILSILDIVDSVYKDLAGREVVITSTTDSKHGVKSFHYSGFAIDTRIRDLTPKQSANILVELKNKLGKDYDVVLEIDHFHIEYDPK